MMKVLLFICVVAFLVLLDGTPCTGQVTFRKIVSREQKVQAFYQIIVQSADPKLVISLYGNPHHMNADAVPWRSRIQRSRRILTTGDQQTAKRHPEELGLTSEIINRYFLRQNVDTLCETGNYNAAYHAYLAAMWELITENIAGIDDFFTRTGELPIGVVDDIWFTSRRASCCAVGASIVIVVVGAIYLTRKHKGVHRPIS